MLNIKFSKFFIILFILLGSSIKSDSDDNYFFSIYPSIDPNNPNYLYILNNAKFITINATEGSFFKRINEISSTETTYKNISSVIIINDTYLVKTCFMSNKLVQIITNENNYYRIKSLNNIKFCYSTEILNPNYGTNHKEKYVIITYYTEILSDSTYSHKAIIFYPFSNTFSDEITLKSDSSFIINDYYPENCITLRNTDIYCSIHFTGHSLVNFNILGNNYVIETSKLFLNVENILLVLSNSVTSLSNKLKKLIPLNRQETTSILNLKSINKDIYLTECHENEDSIKTWLKFSYYIGDVHLSYIDDEYGLKFGNKEINPNLLNYLTPNQEEMLIIYINKDTRMNLFISRIYTKNIDKNYMGYPTNNYFRNDICSNPVYMKSTYIKSFINYNDEDKLYMKNNPGNSYYKYENDIGVIISCKELGSNYQTIKIEVPQCLNELDDINGNNLHKIELTDDKSEIIFDLYNDPDMISFRDKSIFFNSSQIFVLLINMKIKQKGDADYKRIQFDKEYNSITHIKFVKNKFFSTKYSFKLLYTIQNKESSTYIGINAMKSNICFLEFSIDNSNQETCSIDYCTVCESETKCKICDPEMEGITLDNNLYSSNYGKCICDINKGFQESPALYQMCICKNDYSFYNGKDLCKENEELENGPYYIDDVDKKSGIPIYMDCPNGCEKCTKNEYDEVICTKCFFGYSLKNKACYNDNCETGEWFKLDKYIFKYVKIDKCIFIFEGKDLFLISDKDSCIPFMTNSRYDYIKGCLNNDINLTKFTDIENANIYDPYAKGIIASKYSDDNKIFFHLSKYNSINDMNISSLKLIKNNEILNEGDYLLFKADIKREDTISRQVEYQLYNFNKYKINEKIKINGDNNNNLKVSLSLPISLKTSQQEKINELSDINIAFNSSSSFYLDVCEKFTNKDNDDVFLEDRKKEYYINEPFCESGCEFLKYDKNENKVYCKCDFKENTDNYDKVTFSYNKKDERFEKKIPGPNFVTMKCGSVVSKSLKNNFGFFATFFLLIAFAAFLIFYLVIVYVKKQDKFNEEFKKMVDLLLNGMDYNTSEDPSGSSNNNNPNSNKPLNSEGNNNKDNKKHKRPIKNNGKQDLISEIDKKSQSTNNKNLGDTYSNKENPKSLIENENSDKYTINDKATNNNNENNNNTTINKDINNTSNNTDTNNINNNIDTGKDINNETGENNKTNSFENQINPVEPEIIQIEPKNENDTNNLIINDKNEKEKDKNEKNLDKKDIISQSEKSDEFQNTINIDKERESVRISNSNIKDTVGIMYKNENYSRDDEKTEESKKEESIQKEKEVKIDEINIEDDENKNENLGVKNDIIFDESAVAEIDSAFKTKDVKVNTMFSKGDKKKKNSHKGHPANPPNKNPTTESRFAFIEDKNNLKEIINDSYFLDKREFQNMKEKGKEDKRNIWQLLWSVIKNNSTIILVFRRKHYEEMFIMASLIILFISLYLCINTFLLYNISMVKLYTGCFKFGNFVLNIFLTSFFISIIMIIIKKYMTYKDFIYAHVIQIEKINQIKSKKKNKNKSKNKREISNGSKSELRSDNSDDIDIDPDHIYSNLNSKFKRSFKKITLIYGLIGIIFLIFNCILVTSFCGIYSNSVGGLVLNTFLSIIFSTLIRILFFLIGVILRFFSLKNDSETMYNISRFFNPLNLSLKELKKMSFPGIRNICNKEKPYNLRDKSPDYY